MQRRGALRGAVQPREKVELLFKLNYLNCQALWKEKSLARLKNQVLASPLVTGCRGAEDEIQIETPPSARSFRTKPSI